MTTHETMEVTACPGVEVITDTGRRRRWSGDGKARILFESLQPSVNVSEVARQLG